MSSLGTFPADVNTKWIVTQTQWSAVWLPPMLLAVANVDAVDPRIDWLVDVFSNAVWLGLEPERVEDTHSASLPPRANARFIRAEVDFNVHEVMLHLFLIAVLELALLEDQVPRLQFAKFNWPW